MEKKLFEAILHGPSRSLKNIENIRSILSRGVNVNVKNYSGNTLLHKAILEKNEEVVKLLIEAGADVNLRNNEYRTAFDLAIYCYDSTVQKRSSILKILFEAGADVNAQDVHGYRALCVAVIHRDAKLAEFLIAEGADVNARRDNDERCTPLHYAAKYVNPEEPTAMFEILLSSKAEVNARNSHGETALHVLLQRDPKLPTSTLGSIVLLFLKHGASFYARDMAGIRVIDIPILRCYTAAVEALVICDVMDVNSEFKPPISWGLTGQTILHAACDNHDYPTVKFLVKRGADVNSLDSANVSPLQRALNSHSNRYKFDNKLVRCLLKRNPNVNTITTRGKNILTPLRRNYVLPDFLWKTMLRHFAKLSAIDLPIHLSLSDTISRKAEYQRYFDKCQRELDFAKNRKPYYYCWVTYFDLLMDSKEKLIRYADNKELKKSMMEFPVTDVFPIYGAAIDKRFSKASRCRDIFDRAAVELCYFLPIAFNPEHRVIKNILHFCDVKDIQKLCQ